jgi:hypothetical protein
MPSRMSNARRNRWTVKEFNAASRLLGELRRTLGTKLAAEATPAVLARIGLPDLDVMRADVFRQRELDI